LLLCSEAGQLLANALSCAAEPTWMLQWLSTTSVVDGPSPEPGSVGIPTP